MIKKVLLYSATAIVGITAASGVYHSLNTKPQYKDRHETKNDDQIPHSMAYAKFDVTTGEINPSLMLREKSKLKHMSNRGDLGLTFVNRGPDNIGGRSRAILEVYGEPTRLLAGSVTGGLFISTNGGGSWTPHLQFQNLDSSSSIISCIHQDTVSGVIYVGTGSSFDDSYESFPGYGVYKSTDGGETFTHLSSTTPDNRFQSGGEPWLFVNRIRTNKEGHVFAATGRSLWKSIDEGKTWVNALVVNGLTQTGVCADVAVSKNGKIIASMANGLVALSPNGADGSFEYLLDNGLTGTSQRTTLAVSPQDDNIMYIMFSRSPDGCLGGIFKSVDAGESWNLLLQRTTDFQPMHVAQQCQGVYDATIHVSPTDPNTLYIGGVELWRYDGNLTRIASEGGGPPFGDALPNYVHSDKHYITSSPNDPRRLYVTSDGGLTFSMDNGNTWNGINKGYVTTQFYGIDVAPEGNVIMGGTQDNGTPVVFGTNEFDPNSAISVSGGDGFDCIISQYTGIYFSTIYNGTVFKGEEGLPSSTVSPGEEGGDFYTNVQLWESYNDLSSKDSLIFKVEPTVQSIATSNGIIRGYGESVALIQPNAILIPSSIKVIAGNQELALNSAGDSLVGDGFGNITINSDGSFDVNVTFDKAPAENTNIDVEYLTRYNANSVIYLESQNMNSLSRVLTIEHRLESALNPGDQIKVQDPANSLLVTDAFGASGLGFYRNVLNTSKNLVNTQIIVPGVNGVQVLEFSKDGDVLFVGTFGGTVTRVSGLKNLYSDEDVSNVQVSQILTGLNSVGGIAVDPNDANRIVVTGLGFGGVNKIRYSSNALATNPTFTNAHGNLPEIPVYDATFDMNNPNFVVIGTEFGAFATADITAGSATEWSNESSESGYVPVYDVHQIQLPWNDAKNSGRLYLGTFGRGFFESGDLVGINDFNNNPLNKESISELSVYPNPMNTSGTIKLKSANSGKVDIKIYDINGRMVSSSNEQVVSGDNKIRFNVNNLRTGSYFMTVGSGDNVKTAKFMVMK